MVQVTLQVLGLKFEVLMLRVGQRILAGDGVEHAHGSVPWEDPMTRSPTTVAREFRKRGGGTPSSMARIRGVPPRAMKFVRLEQELLALKLLPAVRQSRVCGWSTLW